jgi:hypothetical protein
MEKILVEVLLPAANTGYDIYIPIVSRMDEVTALVSAVLSELSAGKYKSDSNAVLCDAATGTIFDINKTVDELGIKNGSKLILI